MVAYVVAVFFMVALALVVTRQKERLKRPLDDDAVPFPAAGQASTIFSLTALFAAYTGIFVIIGACAVAGLAAGSATALVLIARARRSEKGSYEGFLESRENVSSETLSIAYFLVLAQLGFAVSELLFLRGGLIVAFGLSARQATVAAVLVACIGYAYCLFGRYKGVFRTDILQLGVILLMCVGVLTHLMISRTPAEFLRAASQHFRHDAPYWRLVPTHSAVLQAIVDFVIAFPMGLAFLLASPDTWKRVFIVTNSEKHPRRSFGMLIVAAALPFLLITPVVLMLPPVGNTTVDPMTIRGVLTERPAVLSILVLGVFSCFLSAFDSALISAVQLALVARRYRSPVDDELDRFHVRAGFAFLAAVFGYIAALSIPNPAFIATVLMGVYAVAGALILATAGGRRDPKNGTVMIVAAAGVALWMAKLLPDPGYRTMVRARDVQLVPVGVSLFIAVAIVVFALSKARAS
jgi:hypothetical protein